MVGDQKEGATPDPVPNSEVKPFVVLVFTVRKHGNSSKSPTTIFVHSTIKRI